MEDNGYKVDDTELVNEDKKKILDEFEDWHPEENDGVDVYDDLQNWEYEVADEDFN